MGGVKLKLLPRKTTFKKPSLVRVKECSCRLSADVWKDNPALWLELEHLEVYDYLINTPGVYTKEGMKSRKSLKHIVYFYMVRLGLLTSCKPKKKDKFLLKHERECKLTPLLPSRKNYSQKAQPY